MDSNVAASSTIPNNPVVDKETRAQKDITARREFRRRKIAKRQLLVDEVAALRQRVADLRNVRANLGFPPPPPPVAPPTRNSRDEEELKEMYLGPKPVCPADSTVGRRRYTSILAQRAYRWRKVEKERPMLEEIAALRAEVLDFSVQMRRVGARL
ncbi:hypothetical protein DFH08DRAFT_846226 [Mycena albidolilacea]|uniref:BZIP domain-containing protein n=1 Tax=Mycena albidolilacea TaxID=1033008 RepID=A0AAD7EZ73_9AGAR|nr:hypothetical protein DFH08DRAFT_846226 [Mycena albidolilacea]